MIEEKAGAEAPAISRRSLLGAATVVASGLLSIPSVRAHAQAAPAADVLGGVKAMTFDIQGTLVDYYRPFVRISTDLVERKGLTLDWSGFLGDWNTRAVSIVLAITAGKRAWIPPSQVYREALDALLVGRGWAGQFESAERVELMSIWAQMTPWPDSVDGLARLKRRCTVAALSNAGMAAVIAIAKRGGLAFDAVLTGELVHAYKPSAEVYRAASAFLGFPPGEIMMVAAHKFDLKAAKAAGFKTAYIPRPLETGPDTKVDRSPEPFIDIVADSLIDLSDKFGAAPGAADRRAPASNSGHLQQR